MADEQTPANGGTPEATGGTPETVNYESWIGGQDAAVKAMLEARDAPLRHALQTERENAKNLSKQLKELGGKLAADSEAAKQVAELSGKLETEQRRADFYEEATAAGCRNLRLAWLAAQADGLTIKQLQAQHPDLFAVQRPATHAGQGAQQATGGANRDMNAFIRKAAGRG